MEKQGISYFLHRYDACHRELLAEAILVRILIVACIVIVAFAEFSVGSLALGAVGFICFARYVSRRTQLVRELSAIHQAMDARGQADSPRYDMFKEYIERLNYSKYASAGRAFSGSQYEFMLVCVLFFCIALRCFSMAYVSGAGLGFFPFD